jgi:hypothetical protein
MKILAVLLLCALPACFAESNAIHSRFTGVYLSHGNNGGKAGPSMNLSLGRDGTATVTEDWGTGTETLFGHWAESGTQVTVTFDAMEGQPKEPPMVFQPAHDGLQAVTWNHAEWGNQDPPPMKKGFKVKQLYWLTTGP